MALAIIGLIATLASVLGGADIVAVAFFVALAIAIVTLLEILSKILDLILALRLPIIFVRSSKEYRKYNFPKNIGWCPNFSLARLKPGLQFWGSHVLSVPNRLQTC